MPRMPEIMGESQDAEPVRGQDDLVETVRPIHAFPLRDAGRSHQRGMVLSPLRLRLTDFSGEGERAPPQ